MAGQPARRADASDRDAPRPDGWHELAVANPTFLLERLVTECTDLQGLRELTVNGLDTIAAPGTDASGRVMWDMDWLRFDASGGRVRKVSGIDTGTGMTAEQLHCYIKQLALSGRKQSASGNFGVGAKDAAGSRNPHGLEYRSWHRGQGSLVCFKRHPDSRWGLEPQRSRNGRTDFWRPLTEQDTPWLLRGKDHGTQVVLLGRHGRLNTTQAPGSVGEARRYWITRYLNACFLRLPTQVEVLVREHHGRDERGHLEHVHGEQHHLERRAVASGAADLSDAITRWRVLDDDHRGRRQEAGLWTSSGHIAAVFADDLYDAVPQTRGGYGRLQDSAIRFGYERVTLHAEPQVNSGRLESNTARTLLLLDHEPLPWSRWGDAFAAAMPEEILRLHERAASTDGVPRQDAIRNRLSAILPLYRLSPYRPTRPAGGPATTAADSCDGSLAGAPASGPAAPPRHPAADGPSARGQRTRTDSPESRPLWTPIARRPPSRWSGCPTSRGSPHATAAAPLRPRRPSRPLSPRPARADHQRRRSSDRDRIAHWRRRYQGVPGARAVIEAEVHEWCDRSSWRSSSPRATQAGPRFSSTRSSPPFALRGPAATTPAASDAPKDDWPRNCDGRERIKSIRIAGAHGAPGSQHSAKRLTTPESEIKCPRRTPRGSTGSPPGASTRRRARPPIRAGREARQRAQRCRGAPSRRQRSVVLRVGSRRHGHCLRRASRRSERGAREEHSCVMRTPDPLLARQHVHRQLHQAHREYEQIAEDRRDLAPAIGEAIGAFVDELVAASWSGQEARHANVRGLASYEEEMCRWRVQDLDPFRRISRVHFYATRAVSPPEPCCFGRRARRLACSSLGDFRRRRVEAGDELGAAAGETAARAPPGRAHRVPQANPGQDHSRPVRRGDRATAASASTEAAPWPRLTT